MPFLHYQQRDGYGTKRKTDAWAIDPEPAMQGAIGWRLQAFSWLFCAGVAPQATTWPTATEAPDVVIDHTIHSADYAAAPASLAPPTGPTGTHHRMLESAPSHDVAELLRARTFAVQMVARASRSTQTSCPIATRRSTAAHASLVSTQCRPLPLMPWTRLCAYLRRTCQQRRWTCSSRSTAGFTRRTSRHWLSPITRHPQSAAQAYG